MRNVLFLLFFCCAQISLAEEYTVFEKDGYFGIKDHTGEITVPPVYERLGWSDGSAKVHHEIIGFKERNYWGLITIKNKVIASSKFYSITPVSNIYFKASLKAEYSNQLSYGILNEKGQTLISFDYFSIEPMGVHWLASTFEGKKQQFGVISFASEAIIPLAYRSIREIEGLVFCEKYSSKIDLYSFKDGKIEAELDSATYYDQGWIIYQDGYTGFLSTSGDKIHPLKYKSITISADSVVPMPFKSWTVYDDKVLLEKACDSLTVDENDLLIAYLNGAHHLLLQHANHTNRELMLKEVVGNQYVFQHSKSRKWSVIDRSGQVVLNNYDSIHAIGNYYGVLNRAGWSLKDRLGNLMNRSPFQRIQSGIFRQIIAKKNEYWGAFNVKNEQSAIYKYDSIVAKEGIYLISYLNMWGAMDEHEEWIIRPEYEELLSFGKILIGRRGRSYTVFNQGGVTYRTTSSPIAKIGSHILIRGENNLYGLLNPYGEVQVIPSYDTIRAVGDYFELTQKDSVVLMNPSGGFVLKLHESYQRVSSFGEGYFTVKKDSRWGFVDDQGRLRISNRYDKARMFSEGLAPVLLRGKWGFIDKLEALVIQPYYEDVTHFQEGISIVRVADKYGMINTKGEEVLELIWKSIRRLSTGNYLVEDIEGYTGLADQFGRFILRPRYDSLEDYGDRVLVSKNQAWGVLNYSGEQIFKISHKEIQIRKHLTMVTD